MNKLTLTATALLTLVGIQARAGLPELENVRPVVSINGAKDQNKLTPDPASQTMVVDNQKFGDQEMRSFIIYSTGKITTASKWTEYSLTFTPEKTGYIWLCLMAQYPPKDNANLLFLVDYDKITVEGGKIENGDFEVVGDNGNPKFWVFAKNALLTGSRTALSGTKFVTASKDNTVGIGLSVTAGQPVTVTFNARAHAE
jgi:hypothetical protein